MTSITTDPITTGETARRVSSFSAICQRGHTRTIFTDRAEFEAHMTGEHGAHPITPGAGSALKPGQKPTPWRAPRRTAGGLAKVEESIRAGKYVLVVPRAGGTYLERIPAGEVA